MAFTIPINVWQIFHMSLHLRKDIIKCSKWLLVVLFSTLQIFILWSAYPNDYPPIHSMNKMFLSMAVLHKNENGTKQLSNKINKIFQLSFPPRCKKQNKKQTWDEIGIGEWGKALLPRSNPNLPWAKKTYTTYGLTS